MKAIATLLLFTVFAAGCATMTDGRFQNIPVRSDPTGAGVRLICGPDSSNQGETPVTISVPRTSDPCSISSPTSSDRSSSGSSRPGPSWWTGRRWTGSEPSTRMTTWRCSPPSRAANAKRPRPIRFLRRGVVDGDVPPLDGDRWEERQVAIGRDENDLAEGEPDHVRRR